jgi:uncharacterized protein YjiS (DUF1127 family)
MSGRPLTPIDVGVAAPVDPDAARRRSGTLLRKDMVMTPPVDVARPDTPVATNDTAPAGLFSWLRDGLLRLLARRAAQTVHSQLAQLDDRVLDDIGLTRTEFTSALTHFRSGHGPF